MSGLEPTTPALRILALSVLLVCSAICGAEGLSAEEIVRRVNARDQGQQVSRTLEIELTNRRGQTRKQTMLSMRRDFRDDRRTVLFYRSPANLRDTALLLHDHAETGVEDDQWLYLPSLRKVRRISAANRGDYFLGTDLTYDDIKNEGRLVAEDYRFELVAGAEPGTDRVTVEGRPHTREIARTLGYSRVQWSIDTRTWVVHRIRIWDRSGHALKTVTSEAIEQVQGIWTVTRLSVVNHKTSHRTRFEARDIDYRSQLPERYFTMSVLRRGIP